MTLAGATWLIACLALAGPPAFAETLRGLDSQTPQAIVTAAALSLADGEAYRIISSVAYDGGVLLEVVPSPSLADATLVQVCYGRAPRFIALVPLGAGAARTTDMRYFSARPEERGAGPCLVTHYAGRQ